MFLWEIRKILCGCIPLLSEAMMFAYPDQSHSVLMYSTLGKIFSRHHIEIFFLYFTENSFSHFMQIVSTGDNLHEMSNPIFWEK